MPSAATVRSSLLRPAAQRAAWLVGLVLWAAPAAAQGTASEPVLSPGDMVRIMVWQKPEFSGEFIVAADGGIRHPLYQDAKVAGVPMTTATERIRQRLARFFDRNLEMVVEPLFRVTVGGEVRQPSLYSLPPETTVAQAVALAGGVTERGRLNQVRLVRGGQATILDLASQNAETLHLTIRSGDQIVVRRKGDFLRDVLGPLASVTAIVAGVITVASVN